MKTMMVIGGGGLCLLDAGRFLLDDDRFGRLMIILHSQIPADTWRHSEAFLTDDPIQAKSRFRKLARQVFSVSGGRGCP